MASIADLKVARDFYSEEIIKASETLAMCVEMGSINNDGPISNLKKMRSEYVLITEALKLSIALLGAELQAEARTQGHQDALTFGP